MSTLEAIIESVLEDELASARTAPAAVGYVGCDIPIDILIGSGSHPCHLPWRIDRPTPYADQWLESSFAPWARSMLEDWADGRFDFFESVVFTRGDDSSQRLYYYVCELQRRGLLGGPQALIFDIAKIPRESSKERTIASVRGLAEVFEIGDEQIRDGIEAANRRRRIFADLSAARGSPGALYERIARATLFADLDDVLVEHTDQGAVEGGRVLLAGTAPPNDRLHKTIDESGWAVTAEANDRSFGRVGPLIDMAIEDPLEAVGHHAHSLASGARSFADHAQSIVDTALIATVDAVVIWLIEEDEASTWLIPEQRAALDAAGIPHFVATRRRWAADDGIDGEVATFLEGVQR